MKAMKPEDMELVPPSLIGALVVKVAKDTSSPEDFLSVVLPLPVKGED